MQTISDIFQQRKWSDADILSRKVITTVCSKSVVNLICFHQKPAIFYLFPILVEKLSHNFTEIQKDKVMCHRKCKLLCLLKKFRQRTRKLFQIFPNNLQNKRNQVVLFVRDLNLILEINLTTKFRLIDRKRPEKLINLNFIFLNYFEILLFSIKCANCT